MDKIKYKRMFETRNVRPYYTITHLGGFGLSLKELTGFGYENTIYVTSPEMNNTAFFDVAEMENSTELFKKIWQDKARTGDLIKEVRARFEKTIKVEDWAWKQVWSDKSLPDLISDMNKMWEDFCYVFVTMLISQPQHVLSLDDKLNGLLENHPEKDNAFMAATYWDEDLPWSKEDQELGNLNKIWNTLSSQDQDEKLQLLSKKYGWINDVEGDKPFDKEHYRQKIIHFKKEEKTRPLVDISQEALETGSLIAELGLLRFWSRHHFMLTRYHLKNILTDLVKRSGKPELEFATVKEMNQFFRNEEIDIEEIIRRKNGYASHLVNFETQILTGEKAKHLTEIVREDVSGATEVRGRIANRGKASGRVRVISFIADDYNEEVAAFKHGEVLVTGMTRPQIVHLCKMASAIITDEGGITSHAAVVSREFGIPCIIATHNGTKILNTGDLVEVDADNGIVKLIK